MVGKMKTLFRAVDPEFRPYGRLLPIEGEALEPLVEAAATLAMPESGSRYEATLENLEELAIADRFRDEYFGELPIEIGCCRGYNRQLGALEWHASSEINVAATDFVLILGKLDEMENGRYDFARTKFFLIEKGQAVEIYATTLHFCPCTEDANGFRCVVILPRESNLPLEREPNDPLLFRKNKWIICHDDNETLKARGVRPGLFGACFTPEF